MAFKMELDSLDGLPDEVAKEYTQVGDKYVIQVEGMKTQADVDRVQNSLNAERTAHTTLKSKVKEVFGEEKFEDIRSKLDRIPELEVLAQGGADETKIADLVAARLTREKAPIERDLNNYKSENAVLKERINVLEGAEKGRTLAEQIRAEATAQKMRPEAIDDAIFLGSTMLELGDDGKAVVKDSAAFAQGLGVKDFIAQAQQKKPHWWPESSGGGAGGNRDGRTASTNPFTDEHWNLTEQGKILRADRARAESLAKAAGTTIGGKRPAPKK